MTAIPKIISNVREQLIAEAKRQVDENGYTATTMRSVAKGCGIAVGTVYNYFSSKDMLIASFMLEDWMHCLDGMREQIASARSDREMLECIHRLLLRYIAEHEALFSDSEAQRSYHSAFGDRHASLRDQIAMLILPRLEASPQDDPEFAAQFIAEAILTWTTAGTPFDTFYPLLQKLLG